jgi:Domain of unknown function (DUF4291)
VQADLVCVYQAFNPQIAAYAVQHQKFGGSAYSFERMSWIKPNFLWMMYRAGWAQKAGQERIVGIWIPLEKLQFCIENAVSTTFDAAHFADFVTWQRAGKQSDIRLQWDPDHNPFGEKEVRRAVQIGLRGATLKAFATEWIALIEDLTPFVQTQFQVLHNNGIDALQVPNETVIRF